MRGVAKGNAHGALRFCGIGRNGVYGLRRGYVWVTYGCFLVNGVRWVLVLLKGFARKQGPWPAVHRQPVSGRVNVVCPRAVSCGWVMCL